MYIPKAVAERAKVSIHNMAWLLADSLTLVLQEVTTHYLYEFAEKVPPSMNKTRKTRDKAQVYVEGPGLITGEHRISRGWHAIGHKVSYFKRWEPLYAYPHFRAPMSLVPVQTTSTPPATLTRCPGLPKI
jgi:hypothetical protein